MLSKRPPSDLRILKEIYGQYYDIFTAYSENASTRSTKVLVPIDVHAIAESLHVDGDIIFGRLYYHLERKYGYQNDDGSLVCFFTPRAGKDQNCVNFPHVASVLSDLQRKNREFLWPISIALLSLFISLATIFFAT